MRKGELALLAFLILSLTLLLSGCGPTNQPPNASFSANPTSGEAPLEVSFDASSSSDSDGSITSYDWVFGDGSIGSGQTVTHTFNSADNYTVELTVTDDGGATDTSTQSIDVSPPPSNPPTASFTAEPTSGEAPLEVFFDASNSSDSDGNITSYEWDFDDGSTGSGVSGTYTFESSGTYNVELTVTDNDGETDSTSETISVSSQTNQAPTASFTTSPTSGEAPLEVTFDASGSSDPDGTIDSYNWDFGDGSTGTGETVTHTFDSAGDYTVELTVTDNNGAEDSTQETVTVESSGGFDCEILDWSYSVQDNTATFAGTVQNQGNMKIDVVSIKATVYSHSDPYVLGSNTTDVLNLGAGEKSTFTIVVILEDGAISNAVVEVASELTYEN